MHGHCNRIWSWSRCRLERFIRPQAKKKKERKQNPFFFSLFQKSHLVQLCLVKFTKPCHNGDDQSECSCRYPRLSLKNTTVPHAVESNPSTSCLCLAFWPSRTWKCLGAPEVPHVRIFVWNFPSCSRQLFHILSACLLSGFTRTTRVRGAQPCGAAQVHPSFSLLPPPPPFWHLANCERRSGCLETLQRVKAKIRCLNSAD